DFLDVPDSALVREREGAYQAYTFGPAGKRVKILLLDERYFRDELKPNPGGDSRYLPNSHGDVLGEAQWAWLERELRKNEAQIHIIAGGIQVIAEEQGFEKWANFPSARRRFFKLLTETRPSHPILLSGDRHIAELSRITLDGLSAPLYELTASGMTHTWSSEWEEPNRYRVGEMVIARNYGLMYIDWSSGEPSVRIEVRGIDNELHLRHLLF
ncbi:MAG: alkaline phosphatase D family protein, partial [Saprospiraceae bacterium]|nr:alkaline phosphatase D family protein [Saprospiraceae bacterium]